VLNGEDADNAVLALSAREQGFTGTVVAMIANPNRRPTAQLAGATVAFSPNHILGALLAARASARIHPRVAGVQLLDPLLEVEELRVHDASPLAHRSLAEARLRTETGASVVGQWSDNELQSPPAEDEELTPGMILVAVGTPESIRRLSEMARPIPREGPLVVLGFGDVGRKLAQLFTDAGEEVCVVFSDQIDESITNAQAAFVAANYAGSQKQTRSFARRLRGYDSGYLVIHYRLGLGLGDHTLIIEGDDWVAEWPDSPADSWFYRYGGERVYQHQWGWYLMDVDDASWRAYWTTEVERQIAANEDDGLFIDSYSVPNYLGGDTYTPNLPAYDEAFEAEWTARIDRYSTYLMGREAMRPVIANAGQWVTSRDAVRYDLLDGVMIEGLGMWGPGSWFDPADWELQQDRIMSLARQGKIVLGQAYLDDASDGQSRRLALGSYLMAKGPRSYLCLELGAEPEWFPEYELDLGAATDALPAAVDEYEVAAGLYRRRFERGVVLVNPTGAPIDVAVADVAGAGSWDRATFAGGGALPEDADTSGWRIDRAAAGAAVTVPAHDAVLLLAR
jgi:Trk K+ transport system NAD-binding subunit